LALVAGALLAWQVVALFTSSLLLPPVHEVAAALFEMTVGGEVIRMAAFSLRLVVVGMAVGVALAFGLTALAMRFRWAAEGLALAEGVLHPLPGIALLPLALLWLGMGNESAVFLIVHSVTWPMAANLDTGFRSVPGELIDAGRVFGYEGLGLVANVMLPCSVPYILAGLRIAWARAWRSVIAIEMVFGTSGGDGGLGWLIFQHRYLLNIAHVFAGLAVIALVGVAVEVLMGLAERRTVEAWGVTAARR